MNAPVDPGRVVPLELVERRPQPVDLLVRARRVVLPEGERPAAVAVLEGRIVEVAPVDVVLAARDEVVLADDEVLLPGIVDPHVHLQDLGAPAGEGLVATTRAAAAGGITTLIAMPTADDACVDVAGLGRLRAAAESCFADIGFWGAAGTSTTADAVRGLFGAGALGVAVRLDETAAQGRTHVERLRPIAAALAGTNRALVVHSSPPALAATGEPCLDYRAYLDRVDGLPESSADGRSRLAEAAIDVARSSGVRIHVAHVAVAAVAERIAAARAAGVRVSAETCPHYLTLAAESVADDVAAAHVAWPPIRESAEREGLWQALRHGSLRMLASDHTPIADADKRPLDGDLAHVVPGIASLQLSLPLVWTGASARGFDLADVVAWMSAAPAELVGLGTRKGGIVVGRDADLVVFAPEEETRVVPARLWHRQRVSPYAGLVVRGGVRRTWLRGTPVNLTHPRGALLAGA